MFLEIRAGMFVNFEQFRFNVKGSGSPHFVGEPYGLRIRPILQHSSSQTERFKPRDFPEVSVDSKVRLGIATLQRKTDLVDV